MSLQPSVSSTDWVRKSKHPHPFIVHLHLFPEMMILVLLAAQYAMAATVRQIQTTNCKKRPICSTAKKWYPTECALLAAKKKSSTMYKPISQRRCCDTSPNSYCAGQFANECAMITAGWKQSGAKCYEICTPTMPINPVCGQNMVVYQNECLMKQADQEKLTTHVVFLNQCVIDCGLEPVELVCGQDNNVYQNSCFLARQNQTISTTHTIAWGACTLKCGPNAVTNRVCAQGNLIFSNFCEMNLAEKTLDPNLIYDGTKCVFKHTQVTSFLMEPLLTNTTLLN